MTFVLAQKQHNERNTLTENNNETHRMECLGYKKDRESQQLDTLQFWHSTCVGLNVRTYQDSQYCSWLSSCSTWPLFVLLQTQKWWVGGTFDQCVTLHVPFMGGSCIKAHCAQFHCWGIWASHHRTAWHLAWTWAWAQFAGQHATTRWHQGEWHRALRS